MRNLILLIDVLLLFFISCNTKTPKMNYPKTKTVDSSTNYFGTIVKDPYRWMENSQDSDLQKWIKQENDLTNSYLSQIPYRKDILDRLKEIFNFPRQSAPTRHGDRYVFSKNDGLQNQSILYVMDNLQSEPKILLDPNKLSDDGTVALATIGFSSDGKYFAYAIARAGSDWNEIFVYHMQQDKQLEDHLLWVKFSGISFYKDGFFYSRYDEPQKGNELISSNENQKVYYHKIGTSQNQDKLVFSDPSVPTHGFGATVSDDQKYLIISEWAGTSGNIIYFKDLEDKNAKFIKLNSTFDYDFDFIDHLNGKLLFLTNYNAPNKKVISVDPKNSLFENWKDFLPENPNDILDGFAISSKNLIASFMHDVKSIVKIYDLDGKYIKDIHLPGIGSIGGISANKKDNFIFFGFSSYTTPGSILKYDFEQNTLSEYYKTPFDKIDLSQFVVEQLFYPSKDGFRIPMFLVHKKNIKKDGQNPIWLYGYGGFNISLTPSFDVRRLLWLENGGIYAVANLRGGGEYGEKWHKQGTKMQKQNVFDDFIYAAKYLIDEKYTNSQKIVIQGGSNGGLLVGAVVNQSPDLFKVALPAVGVMDMLRFHLFTIGRAWASDYGLSTDNKEMFDYIYSYSPLHNIDSTKQYPAIMVTTADHDDRVVPAHSFKYVANLQQKLSNNKLPLLIRIETKAGHGAGKPIEKVLEEWADLYAFAFYNVGITPVYNKK